MKTAVRSTTFERMTLVDQIADSLREAIRSGRMRKSLPSERVLGDMLKVSRPLIRQAIHILRDEGLLRLHQGRTAKINGDVVPTFRGDRRRVVLLFTLPMSAISSWVLNVVEEIRKELHDLQYNCDLIIEPRAGRRNPGRILQTLSDEYRAHHWILARAPHPVQEWFRGQSRNVIVMGHVFPEMNFPSVNDDLRAVARHAAQTFLGLGHRKIAFLRRDRGSAGEVEEERGFLEAFEKQVGTQAIIVKNSGKVDHIRNRLEGLFAQPEKVSAILTSHAEDTLVVMNWLSERGLHSPADISLISFQWERYLERMRPMPAWYASDAKAHARKLCRLIYQPSLEKKSPRYLIPTFQKNGTLAAVRNVKASPRT